MPIRWSCLKALFLLAIGAVPAVAQDSNPFAEWDRQTTRSGRAARSSEQVEYFSGKQSREEASAEEADAAPTEKPGASDKARQVPLRERARISDTPSSASRSGKSAEKPTASSAASAGRSAASKGRTPEATRSAVAAEEKEFTWPSQKRTAPLTVREPAESVAAAEPVAQKTPATAKKAEKPGSVRQASFDASADKEKKGNITQIRGPSSDAQSPFAKYLEKSEEQSDDAADFEKAVLSEAAATGKTPAPTPAEKTPATKTAAKPVAPAEAGPQSPGVTVQWVRHGELNVGQSCDVDLVVQNTSKSIIRSVMTEAVFPAEVEIVDAIPKPMAGSEMPTWTFGELKPGETRTVKLKMIPHTRGDVRLDAFVRLTGGSSATLSIQEPMIGIAVEGPEKVEVGQQAGYVIRVSNPGTGVASNVVIQAAIPEGMEHRAGSLLTIDIGTLNPGESRQAKLSLNATRGGAQQLAVRALAEGGLSDEAVTDVVVAEPHLQIAIAGPKEQLSGRNADYRLTVSNSGNIPSANVRAKYRIPEGFEFVSANRGGKYLKADHSIEWFVGTVQPEEASEFLLTLKASKTGEVLHQAGVISEHGQVTMCEQLTDVQGTAALDLKIAANETHVRTGDEVEWTVRISNTGSRAAESVGMSCEMPPGFELISADGPSEYIAENGVMVFRSLPEIAPGKDAVFTITARCLRSGNHRLRLRVASESITEPLIGEETAVAVD